MDSLKAKAPTHWRTVRAHGTAVGLPSDDDMGNSEVGHNALGAGQVIAQGAKLVDNAIADGSVFTKVQGGVFFLLGVMMRMCWSGCGCITYTSIVTIINTGGMAVHQALLCRQHGTFHWPPL